MFDQYASLSFSRISDSFVMSVFAASRIPGTGGAEGAREMCHGLDLRQKARAHGEFRRALPVAALDGVARRRGSEGVRPGDEGLGEAADLVHLLDHRCRLLVLRKLQMRVDEVVHGMQLVVSLVVLLRDTRCGGV